MKDDLYRSSPLRPYAYNARQILEVDDIDTSSSGAQPLQQLDVICQIR